MLQHFCQFHTYMYNTVHLLLIYTAIEEANYRTLKLHWINKSILKDVLC